MTIVQGGPAAAGERAELRAALQRAEADLAVCLRAQRPQRVLVELAVSDGGAVRRARERGKGAVAQCVAGVLAVQRLPAAALPYQAVVEFRPGATGAAPAAAEQPPQSEIEAELGPYRDRMQACYKRAARADSQLAGVATVSFVISPGGQVRDVQVERSTLGNRELDRCLVDVLRSARLRPRPGGRTISFKLDLRFGGESKSPGPPGDPLPVSRPQKQGPLSGSAIDEVMNRQGPAFQECSAQRVRGRRRGGRVIVRFTIRGDGTVSNVKVRESTLWDASVENCLVGVAKRLRFPAQPGRDPTRVWYPFSFPPARDHPALEDAPPGGERK